jgi:hypothetical protein
MSETFGSRLRRFALTVDIVDNDIFGRTWELVRQYIDKHFKPTYWALLVSSQVNNKAGLLARVCSEGDRPAFSLRKEEGRYAGLAAYSFAKGKPLWLVAPDKGPLSPETSIEDKWSKAENLPRFDQPADRGIKTEVLVPIRQKRLRIGVLDLQSPQYNEPTRRITTELLLLADTLSEILTLSDTYKAQRHHTLQAIDLHMAALKEESWPPLTKPKIFVASSGKAEEAITGAIRTVLGEFSDRLAVHYWRESSATGNINLEIHKQVKESQFGLCYFSEPADDPTGTHRYQDNINVVFEAGMFHYQENPALPDRPFGWIPIREQEPLSPPPPFDFAQQRMIIVERSGEENNPNLDKLRDDLRRFISELLKR